MSGLLLVDKSALVRLESGQPPADAELCVCAVTRLEVLFSARSKADYAQLGEALDAFRRLRMDVETLGIAETAQRELASTGAHRVPIPDLLIAACAQQHAAEVLHVDRHFDLLAHVLRFRPVRLEPLEDSL